MSDPKINYIKPAMIHVNKPNTVKKNHTPSSKKAEPVMNRMTIEQRNERLKRVQQHQSEWQKRKQEDLTRQQQTKQAGRPISSDEAFRNGGVIKFDSIEPIWKDQVVYIVGGGPSLTGFDFNRLHGKNIIAINKAYAHIQQPFILYWTDSRFYNWYKGDIDKLQGMKVTTSLSLKDLGPGIKILKNKASKEIDVSCLPYEICAGNNSGFGAIHLAIKLGASKIYLLGYDLQPEEKKLHWHSGYPTGLPNKESVYKTMLDYFNVSSNIINKTVDIYNVNRDSAVKCFKFCSLEDALAS